MNIFKRYLLKLLGNELFGLLVRWNFYRKKYRTGHFARFDMDKKLETLLPHRNGFYVELGANDGALASNSYYFELKKGWTGILIEPSPNLYLSCLKRRAEKNTVFCNACVPFGFKENFVSMLYSDSMTISDSLKLDIGDKSEFLNGGQIHLLPGEKSFSFGARAATLNSLLFEAKAPKLIDFLSLDVEGAELSVLMGIDFSSYNFRYILVECRDVEPLEDFLKKYGYSKKEKLSHHDYLFTYDCES